MANSYKTPTHFESRKLTQDQGQLHDYMNESVKMSGDSKAQEDIQENQITPETSKAGRPQTNFKEIYY